jgi:hypothetical protein
MNAQIDFVELGTKKTSGLIVMNSTKISRSVDSLLVQQPSGSWGLGRISHRDRGNSNYFFDISACDNTQIYVIDGEIRTDHEEFGGRAVWGTNLVTGSNVSMDLLPVI